MDDLSRTLLAARNQRENRRQFDSAANQRAEENRLERALREQEFGLRREDAADARAIRREGLAAQEAQARSMEDYRRDMLAAKSDEDKMRLFSDMLKSGALDERGLAAMSKAMSEKLGVEVTLRMPEKKSFQTQAGHNLATGESYRQRAAATADPKEKARLLAIADRLERSVGPDAKEGDLLGDMAVGTGDGKPASLEDALKQARVRPVQSELDEHLKNLAEGDRRYGFLQTGDREGRARELEAEMRKLTNAPPQLAAPGPLGPPQSAEPAFATEEEARAAGHKAGDIVRLVLNGKPTRVRLK